MLTSLSQIVDMLRSENHIPSVAIARCADEFVLRAALRAYSSRISQPVLIGDMDKTAWVAAKLQADISQFPFFHITDDAQATAKAVQLFKTGRVGLIMKGRVPTSTLLKAVLNKEDGVPPKSGILSHVALFKHPSQNRLMLLTDAGVNIKPTMQRKVEIIQNALQVAVTLGLDSPKVALLAATEKVNYPAMPATLDADLISKMGAQGKFKNAIVAGPMALDIAVSPHAAFSKGVNNPVAGHADILCAPDIESGNILFKAVTSLLQTPMASVVVGSKVPIVVPSRSDSEDSKFFSLALAAFLANHAKGI